MTRVTDYDNGVQANYRQTNFGSTESRISYCVNLSFVAKCRAEKKEDKINTDGTVQDLQGTNLFLSMCGKDAITKLRSLISPRNLIDIPYKDIRLVIQNYTSPKERVVSAERSKFVSVMQGAGESDDDFAARFRE